MTQALPSATLARSCSLYRWDRALSVNDLAAAADVPLHALIRLEVTHEDELTDAQRARLVAIVEPVLVEIGGA